VAFVLLNFGALVGRPFVKRFAPCYQTVVCLSCLSLCDVGVFWPNVGWIKMKFGIQVGLAPGHIVLDGDPAELPSPKWARPISVLAKWLNGLRCHLTLLVLLNLDLKPICLRQHTLPRTVQRYRSVSDSHATRAL